MIVMDDYNDPKTFNKRALLIPILTLMLCVAALMGLGFAYSYTSTIDTEESLTSNSYEIAIDSTESGSYTIADNVNLVFNTQIDSTGVKYVADDENDNKLEFKVYLVNAKNTSKFIIDSIVVSDISSYNLSSSYTVSEYDSTNNCYTVTVTFNIIDDSKPVADSIPVIITVNTNNTN